MNPNALARRTGVVLLMAVILLVAVMGWSAGMVNLTLKTSRASQTAYENQRAFGIASGAVEEAIASVNTGGTGKVGTTAWVAATDDGNADGVPTYGEPHVVPVAYQGGEYFCHSILTAGATGNIYTITGYGTYGKVRKHIVTIYFQPIIEIRVAINVKGAITAHGSVTTLGNISVDGRDYDETGTTILNDGVWGVSAGGDVSRGGSSLIGGKGVAPFGSNDASGVYEQNVPYGNGVNEDGDGVTDEELYDGVDNDGDGLVDEDLAPYPLTPDTLIGQPAGTLKATAQTRGTYFSDQSALDAYVAANGGEIPGGAIIYVDFDNWVPVEFGPAANDPPSIVVMHNATGTAVMKNLHGKFNGVIISDQIVHINGDGEIVGAVISLGDPSVGNAYGNGSAEIKYSSSVLSNLPTTMPVNTYGSLAKVSYMVR